MSMVGALVVAVLFAQAPQAPTTGALSGRVTVEGTNAPLAGVRIMLFPAGRLDRPPRAAGQMIGPPPQTVTDQDGRFRFDRLWPATYRIDVQKTGFAPLTLTNREGTIDVVAGRATELALRMQKGAVITGRVLDPSGEPMPDISIVVMHHVDLPAGMSSRLLPAGGPGQQTNDLGEYRVSGLTPGEYYIVATARARSPFGGPAADPPSVNARTTLATTFYPGTVDEAAAQPIAVAAGAEVGNISFTMQQSPAFRISGIVVDEKGDPVSGAMVMLSPDMRATSMFAGGGGGQTRADGRFTIGDVTPGSYHLSASVPIMLRGGGGGGSWVSIESGDRTGIVTGGAVVGGAAAGAVVGGGQRPIDVTITDADVNGVRLVVRRPDRQ